METIHINENIYIRELHKSDATDIFRTIDTDRDTLGEWLPFVNYTITINDSMEFVESVILAPKGKKELVFAVIVNEQFAGIVGFKDTDEINKKTEIGYWLGKNFQGKGIMTAVVTKLCRYAFTTLDMNRIQIRCAVGNVRSSKIPRRLGFVLEGIERDGELLSGDTFTDIEVFGILKREYI